MLIDRIEITGQLEAESPLHIGSGDNLPGKDEDVEVRAVVRDVNGNAIIPGTGLKGALRVRLDPADANFLFGTTDPAADARSPGRLKGAIGRFWLYAAPRIAAGAAVTELRQSDDRSPPDGFTKAQTRISRQTGAAEERLLYHSEMQALGSRFGFRGRFFVADVNSIPDEDLARLGRVLGLAAAGINLGRGTRQGNGRVRLHLETLTATVCALSPATGALAASPSPELTARLRTLAVAPPPIVVPRYTCRLVCDGPFISVKERQRGRAAPGDARRKDIEPLMFQRKPVLWPSTVLGALRARAAWLAECARLQDDPEDRGQCRFAIGRRRAPEYHSLDDRDLRYALGGKRAVTTNADARLLSSVERLFGVSGWRGRMCVEDLAWGGTPQEVPRHPIKSVSIDRFTGGGREGALFTTQVILGAVFDLTLGITDRDLDDNDRALLRLLFDDLERNGLFLGHGAAKGFGWFTVMQPRRQGRRATQIAENQPRKSVTMGADRSQFTAAACRLLKAPYNFVPLNDVVVPTPWNGEPNHGRPHPRGLGGEITVRWTVETPLLVGGDDNNAPFRMNGRWAIPGASLRGLIRSTLEIASFGRLNFVDDSHFGLRDFQHQSWTKRIPNGQGVRPNAGWLARDERGKHTLTRCGWEKIAIDDLSRALGVPADDWHGRSFRDRQALLERSGLWGEITFANSRLAVVAHRNGWRKKGRLVIAGVTAGIENRMHNKRYEAVFFAPEEDEEPQDYEVWPETFRRFDEIHDKDSEETRPDDVKTIWSYWKLRLDGKVRCTLEERRVPVFFFGDARNARDPNNRAARPEQFFMTLTRFYRVPYDASVAEVAARSQPTLHKPEHDPGLDLCEALFGWVPPGNVKVQQPHGRQCAWRSRVFFSHATLQTPEAGVGERRLSGMTMKPRASFYPFYLRPCRDKPENEVQHPVDYSNDDARLAGRKRYPPRDSTTDLPQPPPDSDNSERLANEMRFLEGMRGQPLVFSSRIRLHNVLLEELGALIWALTFGRLDPANPYRHMLGRAKAYGFGQIQVEIETVRLDRNDGSVPPGLDRAMHAFEAYVEKEVAARAGSPGAFADLPAIRTLRALADRDLGRLLASKELLAWPRVSGAANEAEATVKAYQAIKKRSGQGPRPISRDPTNDAFIFLPSYPGS